ncbi:MAG TPA: bifunctional phosphopantothenoylcysteine decarboxylase/phosphopantothenate--cysteine ligase CoaBC [Gammaproteobacteria bacterium]|nr:bifunctional phosphopantothenoylcysteine decarboxylase/phosphopantothenate--cysteine ligase CoaBC [Gammaproteobacteria bacterium]
MNLQGKRILLGVSGGIAAYKSPDLVRRLRDRGADVRVVLTASASRFVTALTFQAVSAHPVPTGLWDPASEQGMAHIELARWADLVLIAPATAEVMAKLAHGHADDLLTTLCLATEAPLALAPAMNRIMWAHPATQANCAALESRGVRFLGPGVGALAEQESGPGRMLEPLEIIAALSDPNGALAGLTVLVTAGPTREPVDAVRYVSNRSSGRMGYAVAAAAARAAASVVLVSGSVDLPAPAGVERVFVETAAEMHAATMARVADVDIFIGAAAVADYAPAKPADHKIKKTQAALDIKLEQTVDILAAVAALDDAPFTVGFAAETDDVEANARDKMERKRLDMIAANKVGPGQGFETDDNALTVLWPGGEQTLALAPKTALAAQLVELVAARYNDKQRK